MTSKAISNSILEKLSAIVGTENLSQSQADKEHYGRDWTREHQPAPALILWPQNTQQISDIVQVCNQNNIAIVPSGGRTGLAAGAVATQGEVVLSLERMRSIEPIDLIAQTVRVQAGAVTASVHQHCKPHGLTWPIDFASSGSSQIGGNIATNAGGIHVVRYGMTRQWIQSLEVVLPDGTITELNGDLEKNNSGLDLRQLFIGSEGTLGIITAATLKLCPIPKTKHLFLLAVSSMRDAVNVLGAAQGLAGFALYAFEFFTQECLSLVCAHHKLAHPFDSGLSAGILVEFEDQGGNPEALEQWLTGLFEQGLVHDGSAAQSSKDRSAFWAYRELISETLSKTAPLHKNDVAVPISALSDFVERIRTDLSQHYPDTPVYIFGHLGDGNLHINMLKPQSESTEAFYQRCHSIDQKLFETVAMFKGSISAEHGIGLLKKKHLHFSKPEPQLALMQAIKKHLDPKGLMNPGKVFDL